MKKILIIATGGTIDAEPYEATPKNITPLKKTMIPNALNILDLSSQCEVQEYCMKDSKDITQNDLENIAQSIAQKANMFDGFLITHGTDTAPQNGRFLRDMLQKYGVEHKPVALTGAMEPLLNGIQPTSLNGIENATSDGWKNLHYAVKHIVSQDAGVYVAFQDQMMPVDGLRKNFDKKNFYYAGHAARLQDEKTTSYRDKQ